MKERVSFWSAVHEPFMNHDITHEDVRQLVRSLPMSVTCRSGHSA